MIRIIAVVLLVGAPVVAQQEWVRTIAPGGRSGCCYGLGVDAEGHAYIAGAFGQRQVIDGRVIESLGGADIYLAKFRPNGRLAAISQCGSDGFDYPVDLATTPDGSCYVVGTLDGTGHFDGKILPYFMERKSFVARWDPNGTCAWVKTARGKLEESVRAVAAAPNGDAVVTGTHVPKAATEDVPVSYLSRYDGTNGKKIWSRDIEGTGRELEVDVDGAGRIYVAGADRAPDFERTSSGPRYAYDHSPRVECFDGAGEPLWIWQPDRKGDTRCVAVAAMEGGGCLVAGEAGDGGFVARLGRGGEELWIRVLEAGRLSVFGAARLADGGLVSGAFTGTARLGAAEVVAPGSYSTAFVAAWGPDGSVLWIRTGSGPGADVQEVLPYSVAADPEGGAYVGGWFRDEVGFGPEGPGASGGRDEQFVARLAATHRAP